MMHNSNHMYNIHEAAFINLFLNDQNNQGCFILFHSTLLLSQIQFPFWNLKYES